MNAEDIQKTWKAHDNSLEKLWTLNMRCIEMVQTQKAKAKLQSLAIFKTIGIVLGVPYILFLGALVYGNHFRNIYFSVSISAIMLLYHYCHCSVYQTSCDHKKDKLQHKCCGYAGEAFGIAVFHYTVYPYSMVAVAVLVYLVLEQ